MKKRMVIKIGSSSIVGKDILKSRLVELAKSIKELQKEYDVLVVSSGAIAIGSKILGKTPKTIPLKQACAALGQAKLIQAYEEIFSIYDMKVSQILLSHDDFGNRNRLTNLGNTIDSLLANGIIPIINENDALAVDEIKVGDNDTLGALTASLVSAKILILVSDIDGLYDKNPNIYEDAKIIKEIHSLSDLNVSTEGKSSVGTGGMETKLKAAKIVTSCGCDMIIINSSMLDMIYKAVNKEFGSYFYSEKSMSKYSHWMLYSSNVEGEILVDDGAKEALQKRKSLLSSGIIKINSSFKKGSVVNICDKYNNVFAKGEAFYDSDEIRASLHKSKSELKELGIIKPIIHANNIILIGE